MWIIPPSIGNYRGEEVGTYPRTKLHPCGLSAKVAA